LAEKNAEDEDGFHSRPFVPIRLFIRVETSRQKITAEIGTPQSSEEKVEQVF
jgi:hypothetical protein